MKGFFLKTSSLKLWFSVLLSSAAAANSAANFCTYHQSSLHGFETICQQKPCQIFCTYYALTNDYYAQQCYQLWTIPKIHKSIIFQSWYFTNFLIYLKHEEKFGNPKVHASFQKQDTKSIKVTLPMVNEYTTLQQISVFRNVMHYSSFMFTLPYLAK